MIISVIAALDDLGGIGCDGRIPWRLSSDLKRFKSLTIGHYLIMGRKTFEAIGKPLPGRVSVVITHSTNYCPQGVMIVHSVRDALNIAEQNGEKEVFIIGGAEIYAQSIQLADRLYLTHVHTNSNSDVFFPPLINSWTITSSEEVPADEKNEYPATFRIYSRT
jgi:dihydrofolate reductase